MSSGSASSTSPADKAMPCDQAGPGSSPGRKREVVVISDSEDEYYRGLPECSDDEDAGRAPKYQNIYAAMAAGIQRDEDAGCASGRAVGGKRYRPRLTAKQLADYYSMEEMGWAFDNEPLSSYRDVRRVQQKMYAEACVPRGNEGWSSTWTLSDIGRHNRQRVQHETRVARNKAAREKRAAAKEAEQREIAEGKAAIEKLKQTEAELKAKEEELASMAPAECTVCLSAPSDVVLNPCGHRCLCSGCYEGMPRECKAFQGSYHYTVKCPICRAQAKRIKVYG